MVLKKRNAGKLLHIYVRENQVLIKKITVYRTIHFTYRIVVNASSDVDIATTECIFGPNLGALKGKTPKHRSVPVAGHIDGVLPIILYCFQKVVLATDIMFVNKIPFLITVSCGLYLGTIEALQNCQVPIVAVSINHVIQIYQYWGFWIATALADPEFEPLQVSFGHISFNFCAQDEHIPKIECYIRTVKDRAWSGYN